MDHSPEHSFDQMNRRQFLKAAAASMTLGGMLSACKGGGTVGIKPPTDAQLAHRRTGTSVVALVACAEYSNDIYKVLKPQIAELGLPDLKNKRVMIKPNMVDFHPQKPMTTNPEVLRAAVELVDSLGAKEIFIGEGPAHIRDTEYLLENTGIGAMVKKLGLQYIDLNLDDLEKVENPDGFSKVSHIYFPKQAIEADAIVSLPKLKTHHWARMTASMKNLFGVVPGRKYGFPKNLLHVRGIDNCVLDLTMLLKPAIQLVDAVVAMEGDGPLNGTAIASKFIAIGTDPAAVDATCARAMGLDPAKIPYLRVAGQVIGNIASENIRLIGTPLDDLKQIFELPPSFRIKGIAENQAELQNAIEAGST